MTTLKMTRHPPLAKIERKMTATELQHTENTIRFNARVVAQKAGEASYLHLPKAASAELPSPGTTMVEGTINGFPFRAPLQADGKSAHALRISKALQVAAGANAGEMAEVELTRVGDEPEVRVPSDLITALKTAAKARSLWTEITPMARREWVRWVSSARQAETRDCRIEAACDMLGKGKRRPCCFPGINWVTKDHVGPNETWLPLPSTKK